MGHWLFVFKLLLFLRVSFFKWLPNFSHLSSSSDKPALPLMTLMATDNGPFYSPSVPEPVIDYLNEAPNKSMSPSIHH